MAFDAKAFHDEWLEKEFPVDSLSANIKTKPFLRPFAAYLRRALTFKQKNKIKALYHGGVWFEYYVSAGEKRIGIDFLEYIFSHKPIVEDANLPAESIEEIKATLSNHFHFAYQTRVRWEKVFAGKKGKQFADAQRQHRKALKRKMEKEEGKSSPVFAYAGFRSVVPEFEYSVLVNHCGIAFLPESVRARIQAITVIDCGAFIGDSAFVFQSLKPKKILALEPDKKNFEILKKNIELNDLQTTQPINKGVAEKEGTAHFVSDGMFARVDESSTEEIDITTIDTLAAGEEKIGLIKMDIEGYELPALEGARQTILKDKPVLIIAIYHSSKDFFEIPAFVKTLCPEYVISVVGLSPLSPIHEKFLIAY